MSLSSWFQKTLKFQHSKRALCRLETVRRRERRFAMRRSLLESLEARHTMASDFGDAPDAGPGTGIGNYETLLASGGPSHVIDTTQLTLFLGASVDSEADASPNVAANNDDKYISPAKDDEDALIEPGQDLALTVGSEPQVRVRATNLTGSTATLYGWIDVNRDGVFDNVSERASAVVGTGTNNGTFTLSFPMIPVSTTPGATYARFRLSTDAAASDSVGAAVGGEVEDYTASITVISGGTADNAKTIKIANNLNGGPTLANNNAMGNSVANIGDIDGDGVADLAAGRTNARSVAVLLMNSNGTVKSSLFIGNALNGGPILSNYDTWGLSVAGLGDLDGDGIGELAVGGYSGAYLSGSIHVLFLNATGAAKSSIQIRAGFNGGPAVGGAVGFGASIASIGDLDGDGISDLAAGSPGDGTVLFGAGAFYVLRMNSNGSVKSSTKIASGLNGGPSLAINDQFGTSLTSLGDLDGDGVSDLAVGAPLDDTGGDAAGAVHVLLMNANGTVKNSTVRISDGINGGPAFDNNNLFGRSVSSIADLDGDGLPELAVGAERDYTSGTSRGAVHILFMNADATAKRSVKIGHLTNGGPTLVDSDFFGSSVASLGDLDLDGRPDLVVGARGDDTGGANRGALYALFLNPDTIVPTLNSFARQTPLNAATNADSVVFRVSFSEDVINVDATDFSINGTTTATISAVTPVTAMVYDVTVSGGDLAAFNGVVGINLVNTQNLTDRAGNALVNGEPTIDESYTFDNTAPVLQSFARWIPFSNATSADVVRFRANFNEPVQNVDASDFVVTGTTATISLFALNSQVYELTVSGGDLANLVGTVGIDLAGAQNILDLVGNALPNSEPAIDQTYSLQTSTADFGDAPDAGVGTGPGDYRTSIADNGPQHTIVAGLKLGTYIDSEPDAIGDASAGDDDRFLTPTDNDDEDGLVEPAIDLMLTAGTIPQVRVRATNTTGSAATLYGWIDINQDGVFDNVTERTSVPVPNTTNNAVFTLSFSTIPLDSPAGRTYARFRLSTDAAAADSFGSALDGEVEDYAALITKKSVSTIDSSRTIKIANETNGGPTLADSDNFGTAVASIGDLDGDGVVDVAVGADSDDFGGLLNANRGAVHIQFMNANGTVKKSIKIASGLNGGPTLVNGDNFGSALAPVGDLDGDGTTELAVGARSDDSGGANRGAVYVLYLRADGTVKSSTKIASGLNGGPTLFDTSAFGSSIANIGDLNGDSIPDLAIGANLYSTLGTVFVVFMNANGTASSSVQTFDASLVLPGSTAGDSVFSLGDLDNDGVTDIAIGDRGYDMFGSNRGAVSIVYLLPSGLPKLPVVTIAHNTSGGPALADNAGFGASVASVGDLDGDGVIDLAVGAAADATGGAGRGAVYMLFMNTDGTVKTSSTVKLANNLNGGPIFANSDFFGKSIVALGDVTGDKVTELMVGANGDDTGGTARGAVYFLSLRQLAVQTTGPSSVTENVPLNTVVGSFVTAPADPPNTYTFSLVSGAGSTHNSSFTLSPAGVLETAANIDYETTPTLSVRVRTTRQDGVFVENEFVITVLDAAEATTVANRQIFYNRSSSAIFGNGSGNPNDAIDSTKVALLPAQTSSFANYTNYTRGLNGLVIDLSGSPGTPTAADFAFAVWDGINVSGFTASLAVPTVTVIPGGGVSGSTRVKIEFADNDIRNTWLRVTSLANANTGLSTNDVFYFGNAVGDMNAGNVGTPVTVRTNATDTSAVRQNQSPSLNSVGVTNTYDLNKDGRVNSTDTSAVRQNQVSAIIRHFTAPASLQLSATTEVYAVGEYATPAIGGSGTGALTASPKSSPTVSSLKITPTVVSTASFAPSVAGSLPSSTASPSGASGNDAEANTPSSGPASLADRVDKYFASL